jgi:hypothetical protein
MFILCLIVGIYLTGFIALAKNLTYNECLIWFVKIPKPKSLKILRWLYNSSRPVKPKEFI